MSEDPRCGWNSKFPHFRSSSPKFIRESLSAYVKDAGAKQIRAWDDSIPPLQNEVGEILDTDRSSPDYSTILEYSLPLESRRTDVIFLAKGSVVVLESRGPHRPTSIKPPPTSGISAVIIKNAPFDPSWPSVSP